MENRSRRISAAQWEIALEFLERNPSVLRGYNNSSRGRELSQRLWRELSEQLNAEGSGAIKTAKEWATYFNNYKSKLKKMVADLNRGTRATGGGPPQAEPLSPIKQRLLGILGPRFGRGVLNVRVNPFPDEETVEDVAQEAVFASMDLELQAIADHDYDTVDPLSLSPQPSTSGYNNQVASPQQTPNINEPSISSPLPPPPSAHLTPPLPTNTRRPRYRTRPMVPLDEARRILQQVEMQRAAADAEQARALHLIAQNLGRLADAAERFLNR